jgi:hypothetical protein
MNAPPECFALHGDPSTTTGPIACSLCGAWRPHEGAPFEFLATAAVDARALEAARQRVNALRCYYCATFDRVEASAMLTAHDRRGCKHVCFKHAEWRLKRNWLEGHSADCAAGASR